MDFKLDKAHELQRELFRRFAETEIAPIAKDMDESEVYDLELLAKLQKYGFLGIPYSKEYGGAGSDTLAYTLCMEECSKVDASTGITISVHTSLCCSGIEEFGTEEQKQKYLRPLVDGSKVGCFGLTEPGAGSDVQGAQTVAVRDGDDWLITGSKIFTTNSGFADTCLLFALTDRTVPAAKGLTAFIVDLKEMPGISVSENIERMGIRAASNCIVSYDNVRVPNERVLGKVNGGFKIAMNTLNTGRLGVAAQSIGVAQGCLDEAVKYAKERKQFGRRIGDFQAISFMIAEMATKLEAAKQLVYKAAYLMDTKQDATMNASMAKYYASEVCNEIAQKAVQIHGGYGFIKDYKIERMFRDCRVFTIYEGTSQVQQMVIGGKLLKK